MQSSLHAAFHLGILTILTPPAFFPHPPPPSKIQIWSTETGSCFVLSFWRNRKTKADIYFKLLSWSGQSISTKIQLVFVSTCKQLRLHCSKPDSVCAVRQSLKIRLFLSWQFFAKIIITSICNSILKGRRNKTWESWGHFPQILPPQKCKNWASTSATEEICNETEIYKERH